jgi:hypothetical protein
MATKWAYPELEDFNDVANVIGKSKVPFELWTIRHTQRPITCRPILLFPTVVTLPYALLAKVLYAENWQSVDTFDQWTWLLAGYYPGAWPEHIKRAEPVTKSAFEEGKAYFEKNKESLIRRFEGQYIAIWENDVIDSDTSFSSLAQRVYEKLGYVSIYMPFVTSKRRVLRFESPKYRRSRANAS